MIYSWIACLMPDKNKKQKIIEKKHEKRHFASDNTDTIGACL